MHSAQINYTLGADNVPIVYQQGDVPAHNGYFTTFVRYVAPYPIYAAPVDHMHNAFIRLLERVNNVMVNTLSAFKGVLGDMNAASDLLRLVINGVKLIGDTYEIPKIRILARAFTQITEFNSARSWLSRSYDILSGEAATKEPIYGGWDFLRVASKSIFLVNDACTTMKWLNSIGILGDIAAKEIATVRAFGYTLVLTVSKIATISTILGTVPNLVDNLRLVAKYYNVRPDMLEKERHFKLVCYSIDCVSDICRIASSILFNLPNPGFAFLGIVVSTIGTCISLSKFYYTEHTRVAREKEKEEFVSKKEASIKICEQYLQIAKNELHHESVANDASLGIKGALIGMEKNEKPLMQQLRACDVADQILKSAELATRGSEDINAHAQIQLAITRIEEFNGIRG